MKLLLSCILPLLGYANNSADCSGVKSSSLQVTTAQCQSWCLKDVTQQKFNKYCSLGSAPVPEQSVSAVEEDLHKTKKCDECPDNCHKSCCGNIICKKEDTCKTKCQKCLDPNKYCKSKTVRSCAGQCKAWDTCPTGACDPCEDFCKTNDTCSSKCYKCFHGTKKCKSKTFNKCVGQCKSEDTCPTECDSEDRPVFTLPTIPTPEFGCGSLKLKRLDLLMVADLTENMRSNLPTIKSKMTDAVTNFSQYFLSYRVGAASVTDHPRAPLGVPASNTSPGDYCFNIEQHLTEDWTHFENAVSSWDVSAGSGGTDAGDGQLDAIMMGSQLSRWNEDANAQRVLVIMTDGVYNTAVNGLTAELIPYEGYAAFTCNVHTYPSISDLARTILEKDVIPVFMVTPDYVDHYNLLVQELKFAGVRRAVVVEVQADFRDLDTKMDEAVRSLYCPWVDGDGFDCSSRKQGIDVDVVLSIDTSMSMRTQIANIDLQLAGAFYEIGQEYNVARFGLSTFRDKPQTPMGAVGDHCYTLENLLTSEGNLDEILLNIRRLDINGGGDVYNGQLDSMMNVGMDEDIIWKNTVGSMRFMVMVTDSPYHLPAYGIGEGLLENPGTVGYSCNTQTYASIEQAAYWLKTKNIIPIFLVTEGVAEWYTRLLEEMQINGVVSILSFDAANFGGAFVDSLDTAVCEQLSSGCEGFDGVLLHDINLQFNVDVTIGTSTIVDNVGVAVPSLLEALGETFANGRYFVSHFQDKAIDPFGQPGNVCYGTSMDAWSTDPLEVSRAVASLKNLVKGGGDLPDSQLDALLLGAYQGFDNYETNFNIMLLVTDGPYHINTDGVQVNLLDNPGKTMECTKHTYPRFEQIREALVENQVLPVFVVPFAEIENYQTLLNYLDVPGAVSVMADNGANFFDAAMRGISQAICTRNNFAEFAIQSSSVTNTLSAVSAAVCAAALF